MFILITVEDTIRVPPEDFESERESIEHQINDKYCNKVCALFLC